MKQFIAFTKKELRESIATLKFFILLAALVVFGMMSPLLSKIMPDMLKAMGDSGDLQGMVVTLPEPTALDSWTQFFKNVGQMGMIVLVIIFCGIMANELAKGTLINLLTKGLSRHTIILSKFVSATVLWAVSYMVCFAVCYGYTAYFWEIGEIHNIFITFSAPWIFGELLITLLIFGGTLFGNISGSLLTCIGFVIGMNVISIIPNSAKYNPISLSGGTLSLLSGSAQVSDFIPAIAVCMGLIILLISASIIVFNRKKV